MKLGLNGATTMNASLWEDIEAAETAGFELLEIWAAKLDRALAEKGGVDAIRKALVKAKIKPWAINSIEHISFRNADDERAIKDRCRQLAAVARAIGCPHIVVVPGKAPPGATEEQIAEESARILSVLADIAGDSVGLAFEFIGGQGLSVGTLRQARAAVERCRRKNVGVVIDTFHFHTGGSSFSDFEGLDPAQLFVFHINDAEDLPKEQLRDSHRLLPGLGTLPLPEILAGLKRIGYRTMASIEIFRPEYWKRDPKELARACRQSMLDVLKPAGLL
jgi:2-keto-myo-inositol isomerase